MINEYTEKDVNNILNVINDAALKYKGVIPENSWHEPYMTDQELIDEFADNVRILIYILDSAIGNVFIIIRDGTTHLTDFQMCVFITIKIIK